MKKNNDSDYFKNWTTKKLKAEAISYHQLIYTVGCYGSNDIRIYDAILKELDNRGIEPKTQITFNN